jgi:excisionase family DNA binding protein
MSMSTTSGLWKRKETTLDRLPTMMTVEELARLLRVNRNTAYEAVARGEVPGVVRVGRIGRSGCVVTAWYDGCEAKVATRVHRGDPDERTTSHVA